MTFSYDTEVWFPTAELAALVACGAIKQRDRVLDLGCGTGTEAIMLAHLGCRVVAVDQHADAILELESRLGELPSSVRRAVRPKVADALAFRSKKPGKFNAVVERLLLNNLDEADEGHLVITAAAELQKKGTLVLRLRVGDEDEAPDLSCGWGRLARDQLGLGQSFWDALAEFFDVGHAHPIVGFAGLTSPTHGGARLLAAEPLALLVAQRNGQPVPGK
jgi:SAM-dependent methyltransferase